jgi:hypothetical protein
MRTRLILCGLLACSQASWAASEGIGAPDSSGDSATYWSKPQLDNFPEWDDALHDVGNIELYITNFGAFGGCILPRNSDLQYMDEGEIWIGGVVGRDTLVSTGQHGTDGQGTIWEFNPDVAPRGAIVRRSMLASSPYRHREAVSDQDFICVYTDTVTDPEIAPEDEYDGRPHIPLYVHVKQNSYAWAVEYAEDVVLFDCWVSNIGTYAIHDMFIGLFVRGHPYHTSDLEYYVQGYTIVGFRRAVDSPGSYCRDKGYDQYGMVCSHRRPAEYVPRMGL